MNGTLNTIAARELEALKSEWADRTPIPPPDDIQLLALLEVYSASALCEILGDVVRKAGPLKDVNGDDLLEYLTAYAIVYYILGGC